MNISPLNTNILTDTAIKALKNAYEECNDSAAKESIITAYKAIIQLYHHLDKHSGQDESSDSDSGYDASEYCAAV